MDLEGMEGIILIFLLFVARESQESRKKSDCRWKGKSAYSRRIFEGYFLDELLKLPILRYWVSPKDNARSYIYFLET